MQSQDLNPDSLALESFLLNTAPNGLDEGFVKEMRLELDLEEGKV